jgi:hypothetical protein
MGFQGRSQLTTVWQNWRLRPSPPASVDRRIRERSRKSSMAASFSASGQVAVEEDHRIAVGQDILFQVLQRGAELGEDDHLVLRAAQHVLRAGQLGAVPHRPGQDEQMVDIGPSAR